MHAAGVVAHHAPEGAAAVGGGIGSKRQVVLLGRVAQIIEHHAGLNPGDAATGIDLQDPAHVLGEIKNHGNIAALAGERSAAAAAEDGGAM